MELAFLFHREFLPNPIGDLVLLEPKPVWAGKRWKSNALLLPMVDIICADDVTELLCFPLYYYLLSILNWSPPQDAWTTRKKKIWFDLYKNHTYKLYVNKYGKYFRIHVIKKKLHTKFKLISCVSYFSLYTILKLIIGTTGRILSPVRVRNVAGAIIL